MGAARPAGHRRLCRQFDDRSRGAAAVLLAALLVAALLVPLVAADEQEDAIMTSLRAQLWHGIAPLMVPLAGWHPVYRHSPCTWALVTCNDERHIVKIQLRSTDRSPRERLSEADVQHWTSGSRGSPDGAGGIADSVRLLPELAQLEHLEELELVQHFAAWEGGLPSEWFAPGAFPRLKRLVIGGKRLGGPLPDIAPGRLPALQALELQFYDEQPTRLPASWGASPKVLPQLQSLSVAMHLTAPLPAGWSSGFRQLRELTLADPALLDAIQRRAEAGPQGQPSAVKAAAQAWAAGGTRRGGARRLPLPTDQPVEGNSSEYESGKVEEDGFLDYAAWQPSGPKPAAAPSAAVAPAPTAKLPSKPQLPPAWAKGFPQLRQLRVAGLNLTGPLPAPWINTSWPLLELLDLSHNKLHGPLPAQLFAAHRRLTHLWLDGNRFSGQLPAEWGSSKVQVLSLSGNALSGPAFPADWLLPGSLVSLSHLLLSGNRDLGGELPPGLAWPNLRTLRLEGTGLGGSIPEAWCRAPFRLSLHHMWIRGTAISPALPACINSNRDVGRLYLDVIDPAAQQDSVHSAATPATAAAAVPAHKPAAAGGVRLDALSSRAPGWDARRMGPAHGGQSGAAVVSAVVAVAAAVAVTAAGGLLYARQRRVWQQRQWQKLSGCEAAEEGPALLAGYPGSPAAPSAEGSPQRQPSPPAAAQQQKAAAAPSPAPAAIAAIKARLAASVAVEQPTAAAARAAALLRDELESWDGAIDLMPLEALPAALAQAAQQQQQQLLQQEAGEGGAWAAHQQGAAAAGFPGDAGSVAAAAALPAAAAGRVEEITPIEGQLQPMQQQQWHSLAPPPQLQQHSQAACGTAQQVSSYPGSHWSPAGPASGHLSSGVTSSRGMHSSGMPSSRGMHSSRGVHSARSTRSMQSCSSMGACDGQWNLQNTLLLLSPGELTIERDAHGKPLMLGHGRAAAVCLGRLGDKAVAVKAYELSPGLKPESAWRQVTKTRGCSHPRVAEVHGVAIQGRLLLLATELLPLGSLREALQERELRRELRWSTGGYQVAVDVAEALVFLHTQLRLRHGGLSSSNVLLSDELRASVADLGVAQLLAKHCGGGAASPSSNKASSGSTAAGSSPPSGDAGTAEGVPVMAAAGPDGVAQMYAAPEQLAGQRCSTAADIYSFGILLAEIATQRPGHRRGEWRMPRAGHDCPQVIVELIAACLSPDARQRPSAEKALQVLLLTDGW